MEQFKSFNIERADLDELVSMSAFGRQFRAEHEALNVPIPEFVDDNLRSIRREIDARLADRRAVRIRQLKAERESLKTAAEKRDAIDKELAALEQKETVQA